MFLFSQGTFLCVYFSRLMVRFVVSMFQHRVELLLESIIRIITTSYLRSGFSIFVRHRQCVQPCHACIPSDVACVRVANARFYAGFSCINWKLLNVLLYILLFFYLTLLICGHVKTSPFSFSFLGEYWHITNRIHY